jgi:pyruvate formate lyase activating enzyme
LIQDRFEILEIDEVRPEDIIEAAINDEAISIAYTYTEPTIFYEFALDTAELAHNKKLKNVFITNGFINKEPLERILPYIDAVNIDLKFFNEDQYKKVCHGALKPVLETINFLKQNKKWIEITTLIIPSFNDDEQQLTKIAEYIASLDTSIPWHVTAFFPANQLINIDSTKSDMLFNARKIGYKCGLENVYCGNIYANEAENTYCPACKKIVIERRGYRISSINIKDSKCEFCHRTIPGRYDR